MLVLSRRAGQKLLCEELGLTITVLETRSGRVLLGIQAPKDLNFTREEVAIRLAQSHQPVQKAA